MDNVEKIIKTAQDLLKQSDVPIEPSLGVMLATFWTLLSKKQEALFLMGDMCYLQVGTAYYDVTGRITDPSDEPPPWLQAIDGIGDFKAFHDAYMSGENATVIKDYIDAVSIKHQGALIPFGGD